MNRESDVEQELKQRLKELDGGDMAASADEVQQLLTRLNDYRERLQNKKHKWDAAMAPQMRELAEHRWMQQWARKRLSKELGYSALDVCEVAELIAMIERKVGHATASRLLYGQQMGPELANETLGVLQAAIDKTKEAEETWRRYLKEERHKKQV